MGVPNNFVIEPSFQLLSHLREIKITTFPIYLDDAYSPSSSSSCLPTPIREDGIGLPTHSVQVTTSHPLDISFSEENDPTNSPPAPLLKDYDSFSQGSGEGSFDSMPLDEDSMDVHRDLADDGLPEFPDHTPDSFRSAIDTWREHVSLSTTIPFIPFSSSSTSPSQAIAPAKRPRSNTSDDENAKDEMAKRSKILFRRARSLNSVSSTVNSFAWTSMHHGFTPPDSHSPFAVG